MNQITSEMFGYAQMEVRAVDFCGGEYIIKKGDKIGQLILKRHEGWLLPEEYTKDEERMGGFGSTGGVS